jgi:hypothetical protein
MATYQAASGERFTIKEYVGNANTGDSPKFSFSDERSFASRVIDVPWASWPRFVQDVLGYSIATKYNPVAGTGNSGLPFISRVIPWSIPFDNRSKQSRWLWASRVDVEGIGAPSSGTWYELSGRDQIAYYGQARCRISYETRTYDIVRDPQGGGSYDESDLTRYVTKYMKPQGEFLYLDGAAYYYGTGAGTTATPISRGVNKTLISYNLSITWHKIPVDGVPTAFLNPEKSNRAIDVCLGKVNNATFAGCEKGTLLLLSVEFKPFVGALGDRYYDITYYFKFFNPTTEKRNDNSVGHQHVFRPFKTPGWYEALAGDIGKNLATAALPTNFVARTKGVNIYDWADFGYLFRPADHPVLNI